MECSLCEPVKGSEFVRHRGGLFLPRPQPLAHNCPAYCQTRIHRAASVGSSHRPHRASFSPIHYLAVFWALLSFRFFALVVPEHIPARAIRELISSAFGQNPTKPLSA